MHGAKYYTPQRVVIAVYYTNYTAMVQAQSAGIFESMDELSGNVLRLLSTSVGTYLLGLQLELIFSGRQVLTEVERREDYTIFNTIITAKNCVTY